MGENANRDVNSKQGDGALQLKEFKDESKC
jgi:hypothetical protein